MPRDCRGARFGSAGAGLTVSIWPLTIFPVSHAELDNELQQRRKIEQELCSASLYGAPSSSHKLHDTASSIHRAFPCHIGWVCHIRRSQPGSIHPSTPLIILY